MRIRIVVIEALNTTVEIKGMALFKSFPHLTVLHWPTKDALVLR